MNWTDKPIERLKSHRLSHKQRALMELREKNRRAKLWEAGTTAWNMKPASSAGAVAHRRAGLPVANGGE